MIAEDQSAVAQELSNAVWAVATLKHIGQLPPVNMALVSAMYAHFTALVDKPLMQSPANSQNVSILLRAAAS